MKPINKKTKTSLVKLGRGTDRFDTELAVDIGGVQGLTRNISATGIYFKTDLTQAPGSPVHFTVELNFRGEKLKLVCEGEVVRVDHNGGMLGIAAKLANSFFSEAAEVIDVNPGAHAGIH